MAKFSYGTASKIHLSGVTKELRDVFLEAIKVANYQIIDGIRTWAEHQINRRNGTSQTDNSRHLPQPGDNLSHAVDAVVYPVDWNALEKGFQAVKRVDPGLKVLEHFWAMGVLAGIAHSKGVKIRQGFDWDGDGDFGDTTFMDMVHTEKLK